MIYFKPQNCIECLCCMSIEECRMLINTIRCGSPIFEKEDRCQDCTKCVDMCGTALFKE